MRYAQFSANGYIAIKQPAFTKIDAQIKNGFAFNGNRINLVLSEVVLGYECDAFTLLPGDRVILRGDAGLQPWAKAVMVLDGSEFVLCPANAIIGYEKADEGEDV